MVEVQKAQAVLEEYFGYKTFRGQQKEVIETILAGQDALVIMPTGAGKSVCYQVPAMVKSGICVVVSPLIALMQDQVEGLKQNGIPAAFINSAQPIGTQREIARSCLRGEVKLLYVSPERLSSEHFQDFLKSLPINLFAIDEAHCISAWGHDFRPEYSQLQWIKQRFGGVPVVALTATADKATREDIAEQLRLTDYKLFLQSFDRPNIYLEVRPGRERIQQIYAYLERHQEDSGIIYCLSRKSTESVAKKLQAKGFKADFYHAGLPAATREQVQRGFLRDDIQIVCATVAFGMGIDKSNVRFVLHYNLPKNLESYYQEIGRAGRDGLESEAVLFYTYSDVMQQQRMLEEEDSKVRVLKEAKLKRLQEFVEAPICRRRVLLSYFGETEHEDCGNCDVCQNPPKTFDGTIHAQKALSAVYRAKEAVSIGGLVDVLRGISSDAVRRKGLDQIKTFGIGRDLSAYHWQYYISQFIGQGLLEVSYRANSTLKLLPASNKVLFEKQAVALVEAPQYQSRKAKKAPPKKQLVRDRLFERLRVLRKKLADEQGVPPYQVFSDATLKEMAQHRPITPDTLQDIKGVGVRKLAMYATDFIEAIISFLAEEGKGSSGHTRMKTWQAYQRGDTPAQIAAARGLKESTIIQHLMDLNEEGLAVKWADFLTKRAKLEIGHAVNRILEMEESTLDTIKLKSVFEALGGMYNYGQLKVYVYGKKKGVF